MIKHYLARPKEDSGVYEVTFDTDTHLINFYYSKDDSSWTKPGKLCFSYSHGNFAVVEGEPTIFNYHMLIQFINEHLKEVWADEYAFYQLVREEDISDKSRAKQEVWSAVNKLQEAIEKLTVSLLEGLEDE